MTTTGPDAALDAFTANVRRTLERNGYPARRVALPLERMYEVAHEKGLNFNKALALLEGQGVAHEKTPEKVIFYPKPDPAAAPASQPADFASMLAKAQEMMKSMSPEELKELQDLVAGMSDEERREMLAKAKEMGIGPG
jgi:hypothetical protein